jgi:hypothetical protein
VSRVSDFFAEVVPGIASVAQPAALTIRPWSYLRSNTKPRGAGNGARIVR